MLDWCREDLLFHPLTREMVRMKWYVQVCRDPTLKRLFLSVAQFLLCL